MPPPIRFPMLRALGLRATAPIPILPMTRFSIIPKTGILGSRSMAHSSHTRLTHHKPRSTATPQPTETVEEVDPRAPLPEGASLSQKLKHLIRLYGWYALGMYLAIGVLDFAVAFAAIHVIGADHVGRVTASVKESTTELLRSTGALDVLRNVGVLAKPKEELDTAVKQAQGGSEGLYAMIILAYTVHKTLFLPLRIGLAAGLTPKFVGWLTRRGWAGRAGATRAATEMRQTIKDKKGAATDRMKGAKDKMQQKMKDRKRDKRA